ncbi:hypothetical protein HK102_013644 [Quaeritorhiza haematococci]|nr:hypothetical protein HK102_013644 [Quaeritorhiza haematococci]
MSIYKTCEKILKRFWKRRNQRRSLYKRFYAKPVHTLMLLQDTNTTLFVTLIVDLLQTDKCDTSTTARILHAALELMITKGDLGLLSEIVRRIPSLAGMIMDKLMERIPGPATSVATCLLHHLPQQHIEIHPSITEILLRVPIPYHASAPPVRGRFTWTLYLFREFQDLESVKDNLQTTRSVQTRLCEMDKLVYPIVIVSHGVACPRATFMYGTNAVSRGNIRTRCLCRYRICALGMKLNGPVGGL